MWGELEVSGSEMHMMSVSFCLERVAELNISWPLFFLICGTLLAIVLVLFWHPKLSRTPMRTSADWQSTHPVFRDDDRYWYAGLWYNNPDDPALFVPKRRSEEHTSELQSQSNLV